jgi:hypothetical protein
MTTREDSAEKNGIKNSFSILFVFDWSSKGDETNHLAGAHYILWTDSMSYAARLDLSLDSTSTSFVDRMIEACRDLRRGGGGLEKRKIDIRWKRLRAEKQ